VVDRIRHSYGAMRAETMLWATLVAASIAAIAVLGGFLWQVNRLQDDAATLAAQNSVSAASLAQTQEELNKRVLELGTVNDELKVSRERADIETKRANAASVDLKERSAQLAGTTSQLAVAKNDLSTTQVALTSAENARKETNVLRRSAISGAMAANAFRVKSSRGNLALLRDAIANLLQASSTWKGDRDAFPDEVSVLPTRLSSRSSADCRSVLLARGRWTSM
jgi:chromosome segregation ATPase